MKPWPNWIHTWGTSEAERLKPYPCDLILPEPDEELFRAVVVDAPQEKLFLWLCQLRLAPYSYDWIDNSGRQSPQRLVPGLDKLEPGQEFMRIFRLESFEPGRSITLSSSWQGVVETAVTYLAEDRPTDGSRLLVKLSATYGSGLRSRVLRSGLAPGDLVMMRRQLLNLKRLAETA